MENYVKARTLEQPGPRPFPELAPDTAHVQVRDGSKIRNLLRYALSRMEAPPPATQGEEGPEEGGGAGGAGPCRQIVFSASGRGVSKAITCAEIVKRRLKPLHQLTRLSFSGVDEVWEPRAPLAGLDSLTVSRKLPCIHILLSSQPLDASLPGYQAPGRYDALWQEEAGGGASARPGHKRKKGGGGAGGGATGGRGRGQRRS